MFTSSEFERINTEFKDKQKERQGKLKKVWGILLALTVLIIVFFIILFPNQFDSGGTSWILPVYGGIALVVTLVGFLVSLSYTSEKPFFEYLYWEVIQKINANEGMFLEYFPYEKENEYNKKGGLFTRMATVKNRRHVKGVTDDQLQYDVFDCNMTTSNGKSQTTHFDGVYMVLHKQLNSVLQVRTNGSPKLKGVKFDRNVEFTEIKVYKEKERELSNLDLSFVRHIAKIKENLVYKRVYFSIIDGEIHLALWYRKHPARKLKTLSLDSLNRVYNVFLDEYKLINELSKVDSY